MSQGNLVGKTSEVQVVPWVPEWMRLHVMSLGWDLQCSLPLLPNSFAKSCRVNAVLLWDICLRKEMGLMYVCRYIYMCTSIRSK
jgi:hypothetical protein